MRSYLVPDKVTDSWVIVWFPPEGDRRKAHRSKKQALEWLRTNYEASSWNPLLSHEVVEVFKEEEILQIPPEYLWKEES